MSDEQIRLARLKRVGHEVRQDSPWPCQYCGKRVAVQSIINQNVWLEAPSVKGAIFGFLIAINIAAFALIWADYISALVYGFAVWAVVWPVVAWLARKGKLQNSWE